MNLYPPAQKQLPLNKTIFKTQQSNSFQITNKLSLGPFSSNPLLKKPHNLSVTNQRVKEQHFFETPSNKKPLLKPLGQVARVKTETYRNYLSGQEDKKEDSSLYKFNFNYDGSGTKRKLNLVGSSNSIRPLPPKQVNSLHSLKEPEKHKASLDKRLQGHLEHLRLKQTKPPLYKHISQLPNFRLSVKSRGEIGLVKGFGANSNQGAYRHYNEDRMSLVSKNKEGLSFFGVFDGHGGYATAEYLKEHLVHLLFYDPIFKQDVKAAMLNACHKAESELRHKYNAGEAQQEGVQNIYRSGSCATFVVIKDNICYVANVGDCRIIASYHKGEKVEQITIDHKPNDPIEKQRVESMGGSIYQTKIVAHVVRGQVQNELNLQVEYDDMANQYYLLGPHRVMPGKLSVARTFGDFHLKQKAPQVISSCPDITSFSIKDDLDFLILASDGIYDKLTNEEIVQGLWQNVSQQPSTSINDLCARQAEHVILQAINKKTVDNVTVVFIAFQSFQDACEKRKDMLSPIKHQ